MLAQHLERRDEMLVRLHLQQITPRPRLEYLAHDLLGLVRRKDQHLRLRQHPLDLPCRVEPVQLRHPDVHDDDVRLQLLRLRHGFPPRRGLAADFPARLAAGSWRAPPRARFRGRQPEGFEQTSFHVLLFL